MSLFSPFSNDSGPSGWRKRHGEPKTRRELFLCVMFDHLASLVPINLLYFVFWLPTVLLFSVCISRANSAMLAENGAEALSMINLLAVGLIPCIAITGPATAGMARLMRSWAQEEMIPPFATFFRAMRENWKQACAVSLITSVLPAALWFSYQTCLRTGNNLLMGILIVVSIAAVFFLLALQVLYFLIVTYSLPLRALIRNAFALTALKLPTAFLIRLASLFFPLMYAAFAAIRPEMRYSLLVIPVLYYFFVGCAMTELIFASYANMLRATYLEQLEG